MICLEKKEEDINCAENRNIRVAILDTGVDVNHPDLMNSFMRNEKGDIVGYNSMTNTSEIMDLDGHGTHVIGIVIEKNYGNIEILPVKITEYGKKGKIEDLINGIKWAIKKKSDILVICMSTEIYNNELAKTIKEAWDSGAVIFSSVGNYACEKTMYPAANVYVIGVGAINELDDFDDMTRWENSCYGDAVSVVAPGKDIYSTMPTYKVNATNFNIKQNHDYLSGTSQACAYAAGITANYWSLNKSLKNYEICARIESRAQKGPEKQWTKYFGYGRINLDDNKENDSEAKFGGIYGQIVNKEYKPIKGIVLTISDKVIDLNEDGIFRISGLIPQTIVLCIKKDGEIIYKDISINTGNDTFIMEVID